jgi:O-antigen biosynthesis protein WbqP
LLVALAIRLEDGGPAIFRQQRIGRGGVPFTILKFRSMPVATPDLPSAAAGALKITRIGAFIRRTNIDELPQLVNILAGDMSFIGPRPALPAQVTLVERRRAAGVLAARPGLTGLAQVNAYDGMPEEEKVEWERRYLARITLLGDLRILAQTVVYLLRPPPVY